jgi:hypothetical protein
MINIFKKKETPIIEFYCHPAYEGMLPKPRPASKYMPDWFKSIPPTLTTKDSNNRPNLTAKKCMPMLDAMTLGYVIPLAGDLGVKTSDDCNHIEVFNPREIKLAEFHALEQLGPKAPGMPAPPVKFLNPWIIKTAPGWSTLLIPLVNSSLENPNFTCLGGLVDTDRYPKEINFPAIWHTPNFDGYLPAGTPLVVAIPIKRNSIPRDDITRSMTDKEFKEIEILRKQQESRLHVYTNELRESKK